MRWTIKNKLITGFSALALLMLMIVFFNFRGLQQNEELVSRVAELRSPTAQASLRMMNGINQSLAGLRGWMLLNNTAFKDARQKAWSDYIDEGYREMRELSKNWTNPENIKRLSDMGDELEKFRQYQKEIENMANTDENIPSFNMLLTKAAPKAAIMSAEITEMIDLEAKREATVERKAVLAMMADVRGTLGLGLANIRAYLLTGDDKFSQDFSTLWKKNERRFTDLSNNYNGLSGSQQKAFNSFKTARDEFKQYPPKMFELRGNEDWNIANYWLKTKAAPVASKVTASLEDMVENQKELLDTDIMTLANLSLSMKRNSFIILFVALAFAIFIVAFIVNSITKPIFRLNANIGAIAKGDLTTDVLVKGNDEIAVATSNMKLMVEKLKEVIMTVKNGSDNIATASAEMNSSSQQMSQGATEQASSAEEVSSSMEEMAANIQQNADNAKETEKIAGSAASSIKESSKSVNQTVDSMKTITDKISIIGEIARQTNLLALNAAVEAARAGEHGKGFAVVAAEIRRLAERSQSAATEIDEVSSSSVDIAKKSGELLESIVPEIQKTSDLVREITSASIEQNSGANQVNSAIQQLNQIVQQNAASAEQMAANSEELNSQADMLKEAVDFFKVDDRNTSQSAKIARSDFRKPGAISMKKEELTAVTSNGNGGVDIDLGDTNGHSDNDYEKF